MSRNHGLENALSVIAGSVLAASIGSASHWIAGMAVLAAWIVVRALTWGFSERTSARPARCQNSKSLCK
jgi:hypothetical protein